MGVVKVIFIPCVSSITGVGFANNNAIDLKQQAKQNNPNSKENGESFGV